MYSLVQKRRWFYTLSLTIIVLGLAIMLYSQFTAGVAFKLSIDFEGGSIYELKFTQAGANEENIRGVFAHYGDQTATIQRLGDESENRWSVRASFHEETDKRKILDELNAIAPLDRSLGKITQFSINNKIIN